MTQKPAGRESEVGAFEKQRLAALCVLLAGCFWGTTGIFVRHFSARELRAVEIGEVRIVFGLLLVGCYLGIFDRNAFRIRWKDIWCFLGTGVGSLLLMMITQFSAMQYASIAIASVLLYTAPAFVMLLSALLFREPMSLMSGLGIVLVFTAIILLSTNKTCSSRREKHDGTHI